MSSIEIKRQNRRKVLQEIYNIANAYGPTADVIVPANEIAEKTDLTVEQVEDAARFLKEEGLLRLRGMGTRESGFSYSITHLGITSIEEEHCPSKPFSIETIFDRAPTKIGLHKYVNPTRIDELKNLKKFDPTKLVRLCEELNHAFSMECFFSTVMLLRSVLDHVPPIFNVDSFAKVSNNYAGSKSFKESMARLDSSSRKIADSHLHTHIRTKESLPNATQVDFSNDLDVLLSEIGRIGC